MVKRKDGGKGEVGGEIERMREAKKREIEEKDDKDGKRQNRGKTLLGGRKRLESK